MKEIKAFIQPFMLQHVCDALDAIPDLPGMTVSTVSGWGRTRAKGVAKTVDHAGHRFVEKTKLEIVVDDAKVEQVLAAIVGAGRTGNLGDGKIFVYDVGDALRIRTGERGETAL